MGDAALSLQWEFYNVERLAEEISASAFVTIEHVPDHRLRPMIHILFLFSLQLIRHFLINVLRTLVFYKSDIYISPWTGRISLSCFIRLFLKQLVLSCPQEHYEGLLCPLLGSLFAYMMQVRIFTLSSYSVVNPQISQPYLSSLLQRLNAKWLIINQQTCVG